MCFVIARHVIFSVTGSVMHGLLFTLLFAAGRK